MTSEVTFFLVSGLWSKEKSTIVYFSSPEGGGGFAISLICGEEGFWRLRLDVFLGNEQILLSVVIFCSFSSVNVKP